MALDTMESEAGALSVGRSRRSTAGNRMRDLLEQERERLELRADEGEDEMFRDEEGDVDFEAKVDDAEDIVDSDFDQSSDDGADGEDELEGERVLEEEERAARKASRVKAAPVGIRRPAVTSKAGQPSSRAMGTTVGTGTAQLDRNQAPSKRISFAATHVNGESSHRSSQRKSTMKATLTVQARLKTEEKRRQEATQRALPKRKKVKLSQADRIAEALEMEEQNRASLKKYLQLEEERRERDRRKGKRRLDGGWIRFRSVTESRQRRRVEAVASKDEEEVTRTGEGATNNMLLSDPVFAAREGARKEREREGQGSAEEAKEPQSNKLVGDAEADHMGVGHSRTTTASDVAPNESSPHPAKTPTEMDAIAAEKGNDRRSEEREGGASVPEPGGGAVVPVKDDEPIVGDGTTQVDRVLDAGEPASNAEAECEARTYLSLHQLPEDTPWQTYYSHLLGSHVNWSQYLMVPARNRPLRPRQSVCPITGLPALYKDPRSGIAYANKEAYQLITQVIAGHYRWTGRPLEDQEEDAPGAGSSRSSTVAVSGPYDPMEMGYWLDGLDEPGACSALYRAEERQRPPNAVMYQPRGVVAPGDEVALVAAAQALPAGTTRSGGRRSAK